MHGRWTAIAFLAAMVTAQAAVAEQRLALVIEESDYTGNLRDIASAAGEADAVADALARTGFTVTRTRDATRAQLGAALAAFRQDVTAAGASETVALVYFTGHGASDRSTGKSYLLGTDAEIASADDLARDGLQIARLRDAFDALGARSVILIFDSCRDDGSLAAIAPGTKGMARKDAGAPGVDARGLEIVEAQSDMLIAYSTGVGDTATEGVFAPVLTDAMTRPYQNIVSVFAWTQRRVAQRTEGGQKPWTNNLLYGEDVCLVSCAPDFLVAAGENAGLNTAQAKAILASFGYTDIPFEKWPEALAESATRLKELEAKYAATTDGEPAIMALREEARAALDLADFARADELLAEVERIAFAAGDRLTRIGIESAEQRGDIAFTEGRFVEAATFYSRAADHVPRSEPLEWARLKYNQGNALYEQGRYDAEPDLLLASIAAYREVLSERPRKRVPRDWAATQNSLGNALWAMSERGDDTALQEAMAAYREALKERTREHSPIEWAATLSNLGNTLQALDKHGDDNALWEAVASYREALQEVTRDSAPLQWAATQNNLGTALQTLGARGDDAALQEAVRSYREALKEWTRERAPLNWAMAQNNLGTALRTIGKHGDDAALQQAISAYREALKEGTRDRVPLQWAKSQNDLGTVLQMLGERGNDAALLEAVTAYQEALKERTRERAPLQWAATQNNLGTALRILGARGDDAALLEAITAHREALKERTRERVPLEWAATQNDLGAALWTLGERGDDAALQEAVTAFQEALKEWSQERTPLDWAGAHNNLGVALSTLGARGDDAALQEAVRSYREALKEWTRERAPLNWAMAQNNLGTALRTIGKHGDDAALQQAISAYREALKERTQNRTPLDWAMTQNNLGTALLTLGQRGINSL